MLVFTKQSVFGELICISFDNPCYFYIIILLKYKFISYVVYASLLLYKSIHL